jgi:hypothetical protein
MSSTGNALQDGLEWETHQQWQLDMSLDARVDNRDKGNIENVWMTVLKQCMRKSR